MKAVEGGGPRDEQGGGRGGVGEDEGGREKASRREQSGTK